MRLRLPFAAALIVAAVTLSACGGGSGSSGSDSSGSEGGGASTTDAPASSGGSDGAEVKIADFAFDPTEVEVKVGDMVTFTNSDDAEHTATAKEGDPKMFDTEKLGKGDSKGITFDEPGDYEYYCSIHEYMKGTVRVVG